MRSPVWFARRSRLRLFLVAAVLASLAVVGVAAATYQSTVVADAPLAYWRLGEVTGVFADSAPGGLHPGTVGVYGGPGPRTGTLFHRGQAGLPTGNGAVRSSAHPSGFNQYPDGAFVTVPQGNPKTLLPDGTSSFTLEAWVRPSSDSNTYRGGVLGSYGMDNCGCVNIGEGLIVNWPSLQPIFERKGYSGASAISGPGLTPGVWSHLVGTYDGSTMRLYVNGAEVASAASTVSAATMTTVEIGRFQMDFGVTEYPGYFYGGIDEAAVYGSALSAAQVVAHFQQVPIISAAQTRGAVPFGGPPVGAAAAGSWAVNPTASLSDPVNTATGSFYHDESDLSFPASAGVPLNVVRTYNSQDVTVGSLGQGWTHSYATRLTVQGGGNVVARGGDGAELTFVLQPDGSYRDGAGGRSTLELASGQYTLTTRDLTAYEFDATGRLLSIRDRNQAGVSLAYDGNGVLQTATDSEGRVATFSYAAGLLLAVALSDGRSVSYGYTSGRLTSFTDVRGKVWTYTYDAGGRLATIVDPLGHAQVSNVYDAVSGRVMSQADALNKTTTFAWDAATETATVTDPNGHVWKDVYASNVLVERVDGSGQKTGYGFDGDLSTTGVTAPDGSASSMTYDATGNLLTATAPASLRS